MNIIRSIKQHREQAQRDDEIQQKLAKIPNSQLKGIASLPVELWSQILYLANEPSFQEYGRLCWELPLILEMRRVCRMFHQLTHLLMLKTNEEGTFDAEIQRLLKRNFTLNQVPHTSWWTPPVPGISDHTFRNELLATMLHNTVRRPKKNLTPPLIMARLRNCLLIARCIDSDDARARRDDLLETLCATASTSLCCWAYIFMLRFDRYRFVYHVDEAGTTAKQGDLRLEAALLVATGYKIEDVKEWMVRLGCKGKLIDYRTRLVMVEREHRERPIYEDICTLGHMSDELQQDILRDMEAEAEEQDMIVEEMLEQLILEQPRF